MTATVTRPDDAFLATILAAPETAALEMGDGAVILRATSGAAALLALPAAGFPLDGAAHLPLPLVEVVRATLRDGEMRAVLALDAGRTDERVTVDARALRVAAAPARVVVLLRDVTGETSIARAAYKNELDYRRFLALTNEALLEVAEDGWIRSANPRATELAAVSLEELLRASSRSLVHPEDVAEWDALLAGPPLAPAREMRLRQRDGGEVWVNARRASLPPDMDGGSIVLLSDVTAYRRAMDALRRTARLNAALASIGEAAVRAKDASSFLAAVGRVLVEEARFRMAWVGLVADDGRLAPASFAGHEEGYLDEMRACGGDHALGGDPSVRAVRRQRPVVCLDVEGETTSVPWRAAALRRGYRAAVAVPFLQRGRTVGMFAVYCAERGGLGESEVERLREMATLVALALDGIATGAQLRESEQRFRGLADGVSAIFFVARHDLSEILYANPAYERVTGLSRDALRDDPLDWIGITHPDDRERLLTTFADGVAAREPREMEWRFFRHGEERWARGQVFPIESQDGPLFAGIIEDVTDRRRRRDAEAEAARKETEVQRLHEMDAFRTQFLNMAAHELATPLTPTQLQLDMLRREMLGPLTADQRESVAILDRSLQRMTVLVRDLLDAARLQNQRLRITPVRTDLGELARHVVVAFLETARRDGVSLVLEGDAPPVPLDADPTRIGQVLTNLVDNAVKFTPTGGSVCVRVRRDGGDGVIEIQDTGIGLSAEQIATLFHPFAQAHPTSPRGRTGTGLGLFISRGIVEGHGGSLSCASEGPGRGTTLTIRLPAA